MKRFMPQGAALLAVLFAFVVTACRSADQQPPPPGVGAEPPVAATPPAPLTAAETAQLAQARGLSQAFSAINRQVRDAVVYIEVAKKEILVNGRLQERRELPDLFERFFDDPALPPEFKERFRSTPRPGPDDDGPRYEVPQPFGAGSGVLFDNAGHILTNHHVVQDADVIRVRLIDKRVLTAELVGSDPRTDLAVLKIKADRLRPATWGDSDKLEVGEWVLALGNPFGLDHTLTAGIVSAIGRGNFPGLTDYQQYIQTDAAINSGNSGGALVNLDGAVVGINTWIIAPGGGNVGVGFAIPSNMARHIAGQLIKHGSVQRGWLGVQIQELSADLAAAFELQNIGGALINEVLVDSPAASAGLQAGDIVTAVDGAPVRDVNDLRNRVAALAVGHETALTIWRDGATKTVTVKIAHQPEPVRQADARRAQPQPRGPITPSVKKPGDLGFTLSALDGRNARRLGVEADSGVLVQTVTPGSPAFLAGVQAGDLIQAIDRRPVSSLEVAKQLLTSLKDRQAERVLLKLLRHDGRQSAPLYVVVKPHEGLGAGGTSETKPDTLEF